MTRLILLCAFSVLFIHGAKGNWLAGCAPQSGAWGGEIIIKIKKEIAVAITGAALLAASFLPVLALTEVGVAATVTVQNISVTVGDGSVEYGILDADTSEDTTSSGLNDSQTATNNGNVAENFNIRGSDSTSWTLSATNTGTDNYVHEFCRGDTGDCDGTPTFTALTTPGYQTLDTSVAALGGTQVFDLRITTPQTSTDFTEQNVNVTVQAVAS